MGRYWMWHKSCPEGKIFDEGTDGPPAVMGKRGWVDNPAKLGINVWNGHADRGANHHDAVVRMQKKFDTQQVGAVDDLNPHSAEQIDEITKLREENERLQGQLRGDPDITKMMNASKEDFKDQTSDASKEAGVHGSGHTTVPASVSELGAQPQPALEPAMPDL